MKIQRKEGLRSIRIVGGNKKVLYAILFLIFILFGIMALINFLETKKADVNANNGSNIQLANPASVYCVEQGGSLEIITGDDGGQQGICILKNGTRCDEWKYYREEC